jgi:hypothetical protein
MRTRSRGDVHAGGLSTPEGAPVRVAFIRPNGETCHVEKVLMAGRVLIRIRLGSSLLWLSGCEAGLLADVLEAIEREGRP